MNEVSNIQTCPWDQLENTFGPANLKWCEQRVCSLINEPINAWSNVPYILIGFYILSLGLKKDSSESKFKILFGVSTILMGAFSFIYHATNNFLTQVIDFVGMYFYVYLLLFTGLYLLKKISQELGIKLYIIALVVSTAVLPLSYKLGIHYQNFILFIALGIIITQFFIYKKNKLNYPLKEFQLTIGLFVVAKIFALLDSSRVICDPSSLFLQGHAWWHIISAGGVLASYYAFVKLISLKSTLK